MNTLVVCPKCEKINRVPLAHSGQPVCGACRTPLRLHDGLQDFSDTGLTKVLKAADRPVVVDFWAPWCGPCRAFAPTFQKAASSLGGKLIFGKLNTDEHPMAAERNQIRGIPTIIVYKNGVEVERLAGGMTAPEFIQYLSRY